MLTSASMKRNESDYSDFFTAIKEEAEEQLQNTQHFLEMIKQYLINKNIL